MSAAEQWTLVCEQIGGADQHISDDELDAFVGRNIAPLDVDGKRVVLVVPDGTRSCPLPLLMRVMHRHLAQRVASLTAVIALGTHAYMEPAEINRLFGVGLQGQPADLDTAYPGMTVVNHEWADPAMLVKVGHLSAERIAELSEGRLRVGADIVINRHVVESDVAIVVGPVFPHEVVGISGGNKYFIPGVSSQQFIDMTHWVGALITSTTIIGTTGITPVRAMINEGAALIPTQRLALCCVVTSGTGKLEAAAFGSTEDAWAATAKVAAETHVVHVDEPFQRVLAVMPTRYQDIWTAAKGFYKTEPAVADGGEVIIHAPHVTEVSETHREILRHRLPLPRLLRQTVGPVQGRALGGPCPLHPYARPGHLRPRDRRGTAPHQRDPGDRHPPRRMRVDQRRLPRPQQRRHRGDAGRPAHLRRSQRGGSAVPGAVGPAALTHGYAGRVEAPL